MALIEIGQYANDSRTGVGDAVARIDAKFLQNESRQVHFPSHLDRTVLLPLKDQILSRPAIYLLATTKAGQ